MNGAVVPESAGDQELLGVVDRWVALLEREDYQAAYDFTAQRPEQGWTPQLIRDVIKDYGTADPAQRVTLAGRPSDVSQSKEVDWFDGGEIAAQIWYDLNIDGLVSDLTATFDVVRTADGLMVRLDDIHVM